MTFFSLLFNPCCGGRECPFYANSYLPIHKLTCARLWRKIQRSMSSWTGRNIYICFYICILVDRPNINSIVSRPTDRHNLFWASSFYEVSPSTYISNKKTRSLNNLMHTPIYMRKPSTKHSFYWWKPCCLYNFMQS